MLRSLTIRRILVPGEQKSVVGMPQVLLGPSDCCGVSVHHLLIERTNCIGMSPVSNVGVIAVNWISAISSGQK